MDSSTTWHIAIVAIMVFVAYGIGRRHGIQGQLDAAERRDDRRVNLGIKLSVSHDEPPQWWQGQPVGTAADVTAADAVGEDDPIMELTGDDIDQVVMAGEDAIAEHALAVGRKVQDARWRAGMTPEELALYAGFTYNGPARVVEIEQGQRMPSVYTLAKLARAMSVSCQNLMPAPAGREGK